MRNKDNGFIPIAYYSNIFDFLSVYLSIQEDRYFTDKTRSIKKQEKSVTFVTFLTKI